MSAIETFGMPRHDTTDVSIQKTSPDKKTTVVGATAAPTELRDTYEGSEGYVDRDELAENTKDNNYKEMCRTCVIRDVADAGCNNCGIYHYVARLKMFNVRVTRKEI